MMVIVKKSLACWAAAAAAMLSLTWASAARAHDDADDPALRAAIEHAERSAPPGRRPIVETHIHLWQVTRPGGVPWPTPAEGPIFRDVLPPEYTAIARPNGVVTAGIVEASGIVEDNQWILDLVRHDRFFSFFVGNLEIGAPTFARDLARFARDPRFVGIRGYLTGPAEGITLSPAQLDSLLRYPITVGTLFPNFSFLRSPLRTTMDEPAVPAFSIRVWRPVAPDATEVWSWALAHRDAPDDVKARMASAVARTFGSSGIAEQDDAEIWTGMQQGFAGVRGRQRWLRFRPHLEPDPGWRAPGFARFGPQGEHRQWNFYRRWYELLCT